MENNATIQNLLHALEQKYSQTGQSLAANLEGLLHRVNRTIVELRLNLDWQIPPTRVYDRC